MKASVSVVVFLILGIAFGDDSGLVRHFVSFRFGSNVNETLQQEVMTRFMALKDLCVNPVTGENYVVSLDAGIANSPEGLDQKMTQVKK